MISAEAYNEAVDLWKDEQSYLLTLFQLNWWTYVIGVVVFFAGCALLSYVVKMVNSRRIEARYERMNDKVQPIPNNNEDGIISRSPKEIEDAAIMKTDISVVYNNDKNILEHRNLTDSLKKEVTPKESTFSAEFLECIEEAPSSETVENSKTPSKVITDRITNKASKAVILNDIVQKSEFIKEGETKNAIKDTSPIKHIQSFLLKSPGTLSSKNSEYAENTVSPSITSDASLFEPNSQEMFFKAIKNSQIINEEIKEILTQNTKETSELKTNETLFPFLINTLESQELENTEANGSKDHLTDSMTKFLLIDIPGVVNDDADLTKKENTNRKNIEKNVINENYDVNELPSTLLANKPTDNETQKDLTETRIDDIVKNPTKNKTH